MASNRVGKQAKIDDQLFDWKNITKAVGLSLNYLAVWVAAKILLEEE